MKVLNNLLYCRLIIVVIIIVLAILIVTHSPLSYLRLCWAVVLHELRSAGDRRVSARASSAGPRVPHPTSAIPKPDGYPSSYG